MEMARLTGLVLLRVVANMVDQSGGRIISSGIAGTSTLRWISNKLVSEYVRIYVSLGWEAIVLDFSGSKVFAVSCHRAMGGRSLADHYV